MIRNRSPSCIERSVWSLLPVAGPALFAKFTVVRAAGVPWGQTLLEEPLSSRGCRSDTAD